MINNIVVSLLKRTIILNLILLITVKTTVAQLLPAKKGAFTWDTLPSLPDTIGFAGSFAGIADDVLIVAGGSNFPNGGTPWNGGKKTWYDRIFVLERPDGRWKEAGRLPFPLGYGVSVSSKRGLVLIGGSNETAHHADVLLLHYRNGKIEIERLPSLPVTLASSSGALVGNKIFVAGGLTAPTSTTTENTFLCFDLTEKNGTWKQLPAWPGPSRMMSVAGASKDCFFLFSGGQYIDGNRIYLTDAYSFSESKGWKRLSDLPFPVVAAPSPAAETGDGLFDIFGGDTGKDAKNAGQLKQAHPGFSDKILRYNVSANSWSVSGEIYTNKKEDHVEKPLNSIWAPVTTSLVIWKDRIVLPGGEARPGTRTPHILVAQSHTK
jgi:N-acetylneuraminic acid mutarotase